MIKRTSIEQSLAKQEELKLDAVRAKGEYGEIRKAHTAFVMELHVYFEQKNIGDKSLDKIVEECNKLPSLARITAIQGKTKAAMVATAVATKIKYWIDNEVYGRN